MPLGAKFYLREFLFWLAVVAVICLVAWLVMISD